MAASAGVNVLRYSALAGGVAYGIYHQSVLSAKQKINQMEHEHKQQESLMERAKREWKDKTTPPKTSDVITDPMDPKFDLEKYLTMPE
ncbi:MAG: hypothetical protein Q9164_002981 [Protoblastenia rupestris]